MTWNRLRTFVVALLLPLALAACGYNTIPQQDVRVDEALGEVQNQYQRRADLIPNLVATVQGYAQQERTVLREVVEARARATSVNLTADALRDPEAFARFQQAQNELSGALGRLLVVTENYPELRSNQNFLQLQAQLEGTENRIAIARRDYNAAVRELNTTLRTFPGTLWARTAHGGVQARPFFTATPGSERAPQVSFPAPAPPPAVNLGPAPAAAPAP